MTMEYTTRKLSVPSDILNALAGVTAVLSKKLDTQFLQGLPERYLFKAMLWVPARSNSGPPKLRDMEQVQQSIHPFSVVELGRVARCRLLPHGEVTNGHFLPSFLGLFG